MSGPALKRLVGALAAAVLLWGLTTLVAGGSSSGSVEADGAVAAIFDGATPSGVSEVRIERSGATVALRRAGSGWTVNGFDADSVAVAGFLETLGEAEIGELIATNPDNHARMGVSEDSAYVLTLTVDGEDRTLLVGKSGRRFGTAFVRLPDDDRVYLLDADVRAPLSRDVDAWRDRTIVAIDTAAVTGLVVERGPDAYTLVRGDSVWSFEDGGPVVGTAVTGMLSEFAGMMATGFLVDADSIAAAPEAVVTRALAADGSVLGEVRFGAGEGDRWARSSGRDPLYRVSTFRVMRAAPERTAVEPEG